MNSKDCRCLETFLRSKYQGNNELGIPFIRKQEIDLTDVCLISYSDTRENASAEARKKGVHFFIDDYRFEGVYKKPEKSFKKLAQYSFVCTPDFSLYAEMPKWRMIESIAKNRYCGAYWQDRGLKVIPTVSWALKSSFSFCFEGIEKHSIVAVSTLGCKKEKLNFMRGYDGMLEIIEPDTIVCLDKPFPEMEGNVICVDYLASRRG